MNFIKHFVNKENFKTTSKFVRKIVFDYVRRQNNPELFTIQKIDLLLRGSLIEENQIQMIRFTSSLKEIVSS